MARAPTPAFVEIELAGANGGSVPHIRLKNLLPIGLLSLAGGLLLRNFAHTRYSEFAAGLLIGVSIVFTIAGLLWRTKQNLG